MRFSHFWQNPGKLPLDESPLEVRETLSGNTVWLPLLWRYLFRHLFVPFSFFRRCKTGQEPDGWGPSYFFLSKKAAMDFFFF